MIPKRISATYSNISKTTGSWYDSGYVWYAGIAMLLIVILVIWRL